MEQCSNIADQQSDCQQGNPSGGCCSCNYYGGGWTSWYYNNETSDWELHYTAGHVMCHWCGDSPGQCMTNCWGGGGARVGGRTGGVSPGNYRQGGRMPNNSNGCPRGYQMINGVCSNG